MGKKATKKLVASGKLKDNIKHRKIVRVSKQRKRLHEAKVSAKQVANAAPAKRIEDLDIDEFLAGDFLIEDNKSDISEEVIASSSSDDDIISESEDFLYEGNGNPEEKSETDEDEDVEDDPIVANNNELESDIRGHKAQLEALRKKDPEFYAYLEATDKELLAFDESDSEENVDQDGVEEIEEMEAKKGVSVKEEKLITMSQLDTWCGAALNDASLGAVRMLLKVYRTACHYGDSEESVVEGMQLASSSVYNRILLFVLKEFDDIFRHMLATNEDKKAIVAADLTRCARWRKVEPLIKSYLGNTLHLLGAMTDATMLAFVLRRLRASVVFLAPYEKLQRKYLKIALGLFGSADAGPRVQAVLLVRSMALVLPQPALDTVLKGAYRAFVSNAKFVNATNAPALDFMATCVVELHGIDVGAAYTHAFSAIRQLAHVLRTALTSKTKDAYRQVYCWQTVSSLELWARVLAAHADSPDLRPLVYPVTQLVLGTARLLPTPSYFPLRLRCIRSLNRLAMATGYFIPVAPLCLEVLQWADLSRSPKAAVAGSQPPDLLLQLRVSKNSGRSSAYQEDIINTTFELLSEHLAQWSTHISFPELAHLTLVSLRRFIKTSQVDRFRKATRSLVEATERTILFVGSARDKVEYSPKDLGEVSRFLVGESKQTPMQAYYDLALQKAKERQSLRSAQEVPLEGRVDESSGEDDILTEDMIPAPQKKENVMVIEKKGKKKKLHEGDQEPMGLAFPAHDQDEDQLGEYQLSDDDISSESEHERPQKKVNSPKKGTK